MAKCYKCLVELYIHSPFSGTDGLTIMDGESLQDKMDRQPRGCVTCYKNYCTKCTYRNGGYYCPVCGRHIGSIESQPIFIGDAPEPKTPQSVQEKSISTKNVQGKKVCAKCGRDIPDGVIQCPMCGYSRFAYVSNGEESTQTNEKRNWEMPRARNRRWWQFWKTGRPSQNATSSGKENITGTLIFSLKTTTGQDQSVVSAIDEINAKYGGSIVGHKTKRASDGFVVTFEAKGQSKKDFLSLEQQFRAVFIQHGIRWG